MVMEVTVAPNYNESENSTMCDFSAWTPSYSILPVIDILIFILGLCGNGIIIFTVWRAQGKQRSVNIYIGNLALADLMFVAILPLRAVSTTMHDHWPFGVALCKITKYALILNMFASIYCHTCLSFDRYLAIVHSTSSKQLCTRGHIKGSLATIWLLSVVLAAPFLILSMTKIGSLSKRTYCIMNFSMVGTSKDENNVWLIGLTIFSILGFLLPLLVMTVCYSFIGCTVTRHFNIFHKEDQRKKRLLKIIITLVVSFVACWMPIYMFHWTTTLIRLEVFSPTCAFKHFLWLAFPYAASLARFNSCLNPFLYAFFDLRFRSQCLFLLKLKKSPHTGVGNAAMG